MFSCNLPPALLAEWPGFFTCYCGNTGVERIPKVSTESTESQHRKSTLEKKILPPFQQGFEPATFQSRVRCSNHWAIPAPNCLLLFLSWCLMSSDVIWHIRDKLWPMPKHGSIRKVYACLAVTWHLHFWQNDRDFLRATVVTRGWNGYRNKSQHRKSTLEKKILPPFQQGFEPVTFQSRVRCSNHWAIPAPYTQLFVYSFLFYTHDWFLLEFQWCVHFLSAYVDLRSKKAFLFFSHSAVNQTSCFVFLLCLFFRLVLSLNRPVLNLLSFFITSLIYKTMWLIVPKDVISGERSSSSSTMLISLITASSNAKNILIFPCFTPYWFPVINCKFLSSASSSQSSSSLSNCLSSVSCASIRLSFKTIYMLWSIECFDFSVLLFKEFFLL